MLRRTQAYKLVINLHGRLARWRKWRACDVGEAKEGLEQSSFSNLSVTSPTSQLILQPFRRFTYVTAHSPALSVASPTSQFILQPFFCFSYVTSSSLNSPGEPPMPQIAFARNFWPNLSLLAFYVRIFRQHVPPTGSWRTWNARESLLSLIYQTIRRNVI